jgi:hypothetical protein
MLLRKGGYSVAMNLFSCLDALDLIILSQVALEKVMQYSYCYRKSVSSISKGDRGQIPFSCVKNVK